MTAEEPGGCQSTHGPVSDEPSADGSVDQTLAQILRHDLRNPLQTAAGNVALARKEVDCEHLDAAAAALERIEDLVADLPRLTSIEDPVRDPEETTLVRQVSRTWRTVSTAQGTLDLAGDLRFRADTSRLRQLLANLLRNAVEHRDDVTIRVGPLEAGDGFFLEDDGPGIPPGERDRVLEPGYSTTSGGTGYGLFIARGVASAHGWNFRVGESATGGARFEIVNVTIVPDGVDSGPA